MTQIEQLAEKQSFSLDYRKSKPVDWQGHWRVKIIGPPSFVCYGRTASEALAQAIDEQAYQWQEQHQPEDWLEQFI